MGYKLQMKGVKSFIGGGSKLGLWHFQLLAANHIPILHSRTYFRRKNCRRAGKKLAQNLGLPWEEKNGN